MGIELSWQKPERSFELLRCGITVRTRTSARLGFAQVPATLRLMTAATRRTCLINLRLEAAGGFQETSGRQAIAKLPVAIALPLSLACTSKLPGRWRWHCLTAVSGLAC